MDIKLKVNLVLQKLKQGEYRVNHYHVKTVLIILCIASFSFIIIQSNNRENGVWNNYGIECDVVQKVVKGELERQITDLKISVSQQMVVVINGVSKTNDFKNSHRPLLNCLDGDNSHLTNVISEELMVKPDKKNEFYNLVDFNRTEFSSNAQASDIRDMIFKDKTNGFFVEAGAADCENSVTLPFEHKYGWKGILVEAMPSYFEHCKKVNRQAHLFNTCVGVKNHPYFTSFDVGGGTVMKTDTLGFKTTPSLSSDRSSAYQIQLQCYPLYSMLLSLGNPTVNLFVLDIEGFELAVLESIPWDKVDIEVLDVETDLAGLFQKDSSREKIVEFMDKQGYDRFSHRNDYNFKTEKNQNDLFVRRDVVKKYNVKQL